MTAHFHAIVWIDHAEARIFHIGLTGDDEIVLHPHLPTRHLHHKAGSIGSGHAAPDKEFLAQVMEAVSDAGEILVIGPSNAKTELASYVRDHDPKIGARIAGVETAGDVGGGNKREQIRIMADTPASEAFAEVGVEIYAAHNGIKAERCGGVRA